MTDRFSGKVVVVIGGNSGIGLASARGFAEEGASLVITGRDTQTLEQAAGDIGGDTRTVQCDIAQLPQIDELMDKVRDWHGHIDVLFINAGVGAFIPVDQVTEEDWDWVHGINLKGVFFAAQKALPLLGEGSNIVLTGSVGAHKGLPTNTVYSASKAGLRALGFNLAAELMDRGIRVNVVSPGPIDTPIINRTRGLPPEEIPNARKWIENDVPMHRFGTSEEVAGSVLYLASDSASFITGIELLVDGGLVYC